MMQRPAASRRPLFVSCRSNLHSLANLRKSVSIEEFVRSWSQLGGIGLGIALNIDIADDLVAVTLLARDDEDLRKA